MVFGRTGSNMTMNVFGLALGSCCPDHHVARLSRRSLVFLVGTGQDDDERKVWRSSIDYFTFFGFSISSRSEGAAASRPPVCAWRRGDVHRIEEAEEHYPSLGPDFQRRGGGLRDRPACTGLEFPTHGHQPSHHYASRPTKGRPDRVFCGCMFSVKVTCLRDRECFQIHGRSGTAGRLLGFPYVVTCVFFLAALRGCHKLRATQYTVPWSWFVATSSSHHTSTALWILLPAGTAISGQFCRSSRSQSGHPRLERSPRDYDRASLHCFCHADGRARLHRARPRASRQESASVPLGESARDFVGARWEYGGDGYAVVPFVADIMCLLHLGAVQLP